MLRTGIIVETHPEDHSADIVMADDGSRLVGVQISTPNGSSRSGVVDLPKITPKGKDKWDITQRTGQDMQALVAFVGRNPVVVGFLYPQINQMALKDPLARRFRHQSDVETLIDGDGNIQITHPGGTYVRIGENPDADSLAGKFADSSSADRNTGKQVSVRVGMAGGTAVLTISPDGTVLLTTQQTVTVDAQSDVLVKTPTKVTLDTPLVHCTDQLTVDGLLTFNGGMEGTGGTGATMRIRGDVEIEGNTQQTGSINATGSIIDAGGNTNHHSH